MLKHNGPLSIPCPAGIFFSLLFFCFVRPFLQWVHDASFFFFFFSFGFSLFFCKCYSVLRAREVCACEQRTLCSRKRSFRWAFYSSSELSWVRFLWVRPLETPSIVDSHTEPMSSPRVPGDHWLVTRQLRQICFVPLYCLLTIEAARKAFILPVLPIFHQSVSPV